MAYGRRSGSEKNIYYTTSLDKVLQSVKQRRLESENEQWLELDTGSSLANLTLHVTSLALLDNELVVCLSNGEKSLAVIFNIGQDLAVGKIVELSRVTMVKSIGVNQLYTISVDESLTWEIYPTVLHNGIKLEQHPNVSHSLSLEKRVWARVEVEFLTIEPIDTYTAVAPLLMIFSCGKINEIERTGDDISVIAGFDRGFVESSETGVAKPLLKYSFDSDTIRQGDSVQLLTSLCFQFQRNEMC